MDRLTRIDQIKSFFTPGLMRLHSYCLIYTKLLSKLYKKKLYITGNPLDFQQMLGIEEISKSRKTELRRGMVTPRNQSYKNHYSTYFFNN